MTWESERRERREAGRRPERPERAEPPGGGLSCGSKGACVCISRRLSGGSGGSEATPRKVKDADRLRDEANENSSLNRDERFKTQSEFSIGVR
jgi:hypothetical protein